MSIPAGATGPRHPAFRLPLGPGRAETDAVEVRGGAITAVCAGAGAGLARLAAAVRAAAVRGNGPLRPGANAPEVERLGGDSSPLRLASVSSRSGLTPLSDVTENIFLNRLQVRRVGPVPVGLDWPRMRTEAAEALRLVGSAVDVTTRARDLSDLDRVLVELARAASSAVELLVVEEPTALLHDPAGRDVGTERILSALDGFRARGVAVVVLTQKPRQALGYADAVVVVHGEAVVGRHERAEWEASGVEAVRERVLAEMVPGAQPVARDGAAAGIGTAPRPELLRIEGWTALDVLPPHPVLVDDVDLVLGAGEILGVTGLARAGGESLLLSVYGRSAGVEARGRVLVRGTEVDTGSVQQAIEAGLFFAAADPPSYRLRVVGGISVPVAANRMRGLADAGMIEEKVDDPGAPGRLLSAIRSAGPEGDALKRIRGLVREFAGSDRAVLILGEPLRGASASERAEVVEGLRSAARAGKGVIVVSDDLELLLGLCDRVVALAEGRVTGEVPGGSAPAALAALIAPD